MKFTLLALVIMMSPVACRAVPEISGVFTVSGTTMFVLIESETGASSGWIKVGDAFGGYVLKSFDAAREVLVLTRDGKTLEVGLRAAATKEMRIALSGPIQLRAGEEIEAQRVVLVFDEQSSFPLGAGTTLFITPKRRPDGNIEYRARLEKVMDDGTKQALGVPRVITRPGGAFSVRVGDVGFDLKP